MDIDILVLDNGLKNKYNSFKNNIQEYNDKLEILENIISNNKDSNIIKELYIHKQKLNEFIEDVKTDKSYSYYLMESSQIIDTYNEIINKPVVIDFMNNNNTFKKNTKEIIKEYLDIYNKYNNKILIQSDNNVNCNICRNNNFIIIENNKICEHCGTTMNIIHQNSSYKDSERINITPKYSYDRKIHFRDCINQFQGKQQVSIKDNVYKDLIKQCELNHLVSLDKSIPNEIRFANITKNNIHMFLKETGHSKHYENITYIYHHLTGKKTNDISHLESSLLDDFELLTIEYDKLYKNNKTIERKSFMNSQYILYQLLLKHKYKCNKEDFNILKTSDRQVFHDEICKEIFKRLGWNFTCIF